MNQTDFKSIKPRHYSIKEREDKLRESVEIELDVLDSDQQSLWLAEAAILINEDTVLDHVRFTRLSPEGQPLRLKIKGTHTLTAHINHVYEVLN